MPDAPTAAGEVLAPEVWRLLTMEDPLNVDITRVAAGLATLAQQSGDPRLLVAAGQLSHLAWRILRTKTARLLDRAAATPATTPPIVDELDGWADFLEAAPFQGLDMAEEYTRRVNHSPQGPLEVGRHRGFATPRPVSLDELVHALHQALQDADAHLSHHAVVDEHRARARQRRQGAATSMHDDDPQRDVAQLLERLPNGPPVPLRTLLHQGDGRRTLVGLLIASLHLARTGHIHLHQPAFPNGPLLLSRSPAAPADASPAAPVDAPVTGE